MSPDDYPDAEDVSLLEPDLEAAPPVGAHMAVQQANGLWAGIPRYAIIALIENRQKVDKIQVIGLVDIRINHGEHNKIEILGMCPCRQKDCTRRVKLSGSWKGNHPQKFGSDVENLARSVLKKD